MTKRLIYETYSWLKFERDCQEIAAWARQQRRKFRSVYGLPRGGLVPAVVLSHLLDITYVHSREDVTPDTLIVDDIVDKGATIPRHFPALGSKFRVAVLFFNPHSPYTPDFFVRPKKRNHFIIFPWETKETARYDRTV